MAKIAFIVTCSPVLVLLLVWYMISKHRNFRAYFIPAFILLVLITGTITYYAPSEEEEFRLLISIVSTWPLWFTFPLMLFMRRNELNVFLVPVFCIFLSAVAIYLGLLRIMFSAGFQN